MLFLFPLWNKYLLQVPRSFALIYRTFSCHKCSRIRAVGGPILCPNIPFMLGKEFFKLLQQ